MLTGILTDVDPSVRRGAAVLRLMYLDDMRNLQKRMNELTSTMQSYTAHPTTDVKLGKVGR